DSVKPTMAFKTLRTGTTLAKATIDGKYFYAKLVIRPTAGARVVLDPATAAVATGGTVQFVASGRTSKGETARVDVTWSTTGGTISPTGLFVAGTTPGTF